MNILSIDTTTNFLYIGLYYNNFLLKFSKKNDLDYLNNIINDINYFLNKNNISISNIDFITCVCGPGNFTSTKIGICVSQGLSIGNKIPIIKLNSLEILAEGSYRIYNKKNNIISMITGYSKLIYWSSFYISNKSICISKFKNIKLTYLCDVIDYIYKCNLNNTKWIISGTAYINYINKLIDNKIEILFSNIKLQEIEDTINLSLKLIKNNKILKNKKLFPIY